MISKADNSHNVVKKKQTTPLKSGLVLAIKLSEKKEMLAATITDNDRIGQPSLATFVLYWAPVQSSFFENFYDCRNPYFNMLA